jgi:hypothetical protein
MRQRLRTVVCMLIAIAVLLVGTMQLAEAQYRRSPRPVPQPMPPVRSVPEPSASLYLGMALFALAGYGWWSRKKSQVQH